MRGGTSSALISGYSTFLRLRSEARCCRRGRFLSHAEFGRERGAAMERNDASHDGTGRGRSVGQRSVGREERSSRDTSRERSSARGPLNPTSAGSPRAPPPGARPRLQVSGFWGSIRTTHLLGPGFGVALGGLGVDVRRRANDEAHGGTDHDSHVSVCGVARRGAARSEGATDVDRDNRHRKRRKENEEAWPAVRPRWRRPRVRPLSLKNARIKKDEKTKTARHTSDRIIRDGESETGVLFRTERSFVIGSESQTECSVDLGQNPPSGFF